MRSGFYSDGGELPVVRFGDLVLPSEHASQGGAADAELAGGGRLVPAVALEHLPHDGALDLVERSLEVVRVLAREADGSLTYLG
jgi:hypothetical protein